MHDKVPVAGDLRDLIIRVVRGNPTSFDLDQLAKVCQAIGMARLTTRIGRGTFNPAPFGLSPADIAYDCVADLFQRDTNGEIARIKFYFQGIDINKTHADELFIHLRRLVFSAINQGILHIYQQFDPSLAKILRNIRISVASFDNFIETDLFGEKCIGPALCDLLESLPVMDTRTLADCLQPLISGNERTPEILSKVSKYLREQDEHCRLVSVTSLALAIREVVSAKQRIAESSEFDSSAETKMDVALAIHRACTEVRRTVARKYADKGKIDDSVLDSYLSAIETMLENKFTLNDGRESSLYTELQARIPALSPEVYRLVHRGKIEYLHRLASSHVKAVLQADRN